MADADPSTVLAAIRGRQRYIDGPAYVEDIRASADDVLRLLAAVEAVLKEHQPVDRGEGLEPTCGTCHRGFWPCSTVQAITAALAGEEAGGDA
jgi:hypothetical protein